MIEAQRIDIKTYRYNTCPVCEDTKVKMLNEDFDGSYIVTIECKTCGALWVELHTLTGVYVISEKEIVK